MGEVTFVVRGLSDADMAEQVEATLYAKVGVHQVKADWESGRIWLSYDERLVPQPRLRSYVQSSGVSVVGPA
jgi:hypothetical protein